MPPEPAPRSATDPVVGRYRLEFAIGPDCELLPVAERTRRYIADIESDPREGGDYRVKLYNASFLEGRTCGDPRWSDVTNLCHQFRAAGGPGALVFEFLGGPDDNLNTNVIYEDIGANVWLGLIGTASGKMEGPTITASGGTFVERWVGGFASYTSCTAGPTVPPASVRLTFVRQ